MAMLQHRSSPLFPETPKRNRLRMQTKNWAKLGGQHRYCHFVWNTVVGFAQQGFRSLRVDIFRLNLEYFWMTTSSSLRSALQIREKGNGQERLPSSRTVLTQHCYNEHCHNEHCVVEILLLADRADFPFPNCDPEEKSRRVAYGSMGLSFLFTCRRTIASLEFSSSWVSQSRDDNDYQS